MKPIQKTRPDIATQGRTCSRQRRILRRRVEQSTGNEALGSGRASNKYDSRNDRCAPAIGDRKAGGERSSVAHQLVRLQHVQAVLLPDQHEVVAQLGLQGVLLDQLRVLLDHPPQLIVVCTRKGGFRSSFSVKLRNWVPNAPELSCGRAYFYISFRVLRKCTS
jgi:hypothetical protein